MGNQLATSQQPDYNNLPDIGSALTFQERLGGGRFLKTLKCVNEDGILVVKVRCSQKPPRVLRSLQVAHGPTPPSHCAGLLQTRPRRLPRKLRGNAHRGAPPHAPPHAPPQPRTPPRAAAPRLPRRRYPTPYVRFVLQVRARLTVNGAPNVMPFRWFRESAHAAYLVRQYFHANLLERLSSPPFLCLVEKQWLAFQLLQAVAQCHGAGVCHGDIKAENVLLTSMNWLFLSDPASFKPASLPQDDPADFSYFFDSSSRRSCNLAPERFVDPGLVGKAAAGVSANTGLRLTPAMDIFSAGCVLTELLREGEPCFDLPQLLRYRRGALDPTTGLLQVQGSGGSGGAGGAGEQGTGRWQGRLQGQWGSGMAPSPTLPCQDPLLTMA